VFSFRPTGFYCNVIYIYRYIPSVKNVGFFIFVLYCSIHDGKVKNLFFFPVFFLAISLVCLCISQTLNKYILVVHTVILFLAIITIIKKERKGSSMLPSMDMANNYFMSYAMVSYYSFYNLYTPT
jgi:hypothetical protein